jgi:hypothetical protein
MNVKIRFISSLGHDIVGEFFQESRQISGAHFPFL